MSDKAKNPLENMDPILKNAFSNSEQTEEVEVDFDLNEVLENESSTSDASVDIKKVNFSDSSEVEPVQIPNDSLIANLPVTVSVELGRCKLTISDLESLCEGSLVELDRFVGEPLDLVVNNNVIAQGEVVSVDNKFGLKIKTISNNIEL